MTFVIGVRNLATHGLVLHSMGCNWQHVFNGTSLLTELRFTWSSKDLPGGTTSRQCANRGVFLKKTDTWELEKSNDTFGKKTWPKPWKKHNLYIYDIYDY